MNLQHNHRHHRKPSVPRNHMLGNILALGLLADILLSGPALAQMASSAQDLELASQRISSAAAGRDIALSSVVVDGRLSAGRNVDGRDCTIRGSVSAGHNVRLEQCAEVQSVSSGHNADVSQAKVLAYISSGHDIHVNDASVELGLNAGNQVTTRNATINGPISLGGSYARLDHSTTGDIVFTNSNLSISTYSANAGASLSPVEITVGHGTQVSGNVINSTIVNQSSQFNQSIQASGNASSSVVRRNSNGSTFVRVGGRGVSSVNGFTVQGSPSQTTVITPEQSIYVNGARVSGDGPKTYQQYRQTHPNAPTVEGPGWDTRQNQVTQASIACKNSETDAINTLELVNQAVVNGNVVFESGYGQVLVYPGSSFNGKVVNGRVEHIKQATAE